MPEPTIQAPNPNLVYDYEKAFMSGVDNPDIYGFVSKANVQIKPPSDLQTFAEKYPNYNEGQIKQLHANLLLNYRQYKDLDFNRYDSKFNIQDFKPVDRPMLSSPVLFKSIPGGSDEFFRHPDQVATEFGYAKTKDDKWIALNEFEKGDFNYAKRMEGDGITEPYYYWQEGKDNEIIEPTALKTFWGDRRVDTPSIWNSIGRGLVSGGIGKLSTGIGQFAEVLGDLSNPEQLDNKLSDVFGSRLTNWGNYVTKQNVDESEPYFSNINAFLYNTADGVGQLISMIGTSYATGGLASVTGLLKIAPNIATQMAFVVGSAEAAGAFRQEMKAMGMDDLASAKWYWPFFAATYISERIIPGDLAERSFNRTLTKNASNILRQADSRAFRETGKRLVDLPDQAKRRYFQGVWKGLAESYDKVRDISSRFTVGSVLLSSFDEAIEEYIEGGLDMGIQNMYNGMKVGIAENNIKRYGNVKFDTKFNDDGSVSHYRIEKDGSRKEIELEEMMRNQSDLKEAEAVMSGDGLWTPSFSMEEGYVAGISTLVTLGFGKLTSTLLKSNRKKNNMFAIEQAIKELRNPSAQTRFDESLRNLKPKLGKDYINAETGKVMTYGEQGDTQADVIAQGIRSEIDFYKNIIQNKIGLSNVATPNDLAKHGGRNAVTEAIDLMGDIDNLNTRLSQINAGEDITAAENITDSKDTKLINDLIKDKQKHVDKIMTIQENGVSQFVNERTVKTILNDKMKGFDDTTINQYEEQSKALAEQRKTMKEKGFKDSVEKRTKSIIGNFESIIKSGDVGNFIDNIGTVLSSLEEFSKGYMTPELYQGIRENMLPQIQQLRNTIVNKEGNATLGGQEVNLGEMIDNALALGEATNDDMMLNIQDAVTGVEDMFNFFGNDVEYKGKPIEYDEATDNAVTFDFLTKGIDIQRINELSALASIGEDDSALIDELDKNIDIITNAENHVRYMAYMNDIKERTNIPIQTAVIPNNDNLNKILPRLFDLKQINEFVKEIIDKNSKEGKKTEERKKRSFISKDIVSLELIIASLTKVQQTVDPNITKKFDALKEALGTSDNADYLSDASEYTNIQKQITEIESLIYRTVQTNKNKKDIVEDVLVPYRMDYRRGDETKNIFIIENGETINANEIPFDNKAIKFHYISNYINTILGSDSQQFHTDLSDIVFKFKLENQEYIPGIEQTKILRHAYNFITTDTPFYFTSLEGSNVTVKAIEELDGRTNSLFIPGDNGSGKTKVIMPIINHLLDKHMNRNDIKASVLTVEPSNELASQVKKSQSKNHKNIHYIQPESINDFFRKRTEYKKQFKSFNTNMVVIYIDEASRLNNSHLEKIRDDFSIKSDKKMDYRIIYLGDPNQATYLNENGDLPFTLPVRFTSQSTITTTRKYRAGMNKDVTRVIELVSAHQKFQNYNTIILPSTKYNSLKSKGVEYYKSVNEVTQAWMNEATNDRVLIFPFKEDVEFFISSNESFFTKNPKLKDNVRYVLLGKTLSALTDEVDNTVSGLEFSKVYVAMDMPNATDYFELRILGTAVGRTSITKEGESYLAMVADAQSVEDENIEIFEPERKNQRTIEEYFADRKYLSALSAKKSSTKKEVKKQQEATTNIGSTSIFSPFEEGATEFESTEFTKNHEFVGKSFQTDNGESFVVSQVKFSGSDVIEVMDIDGNFHDFEDLTPFDAGWNNNFDEIASIEDKFIDEETLSIIGNERYNSYSNSKYFHKEGGSHNLAVYIGHSLTDEVGGYDVNKDPIKSRLELIERYMSQRGGLEVRYYRTYKKANKTFNNVLTVEDSTGYIISVLHHPEANGNAFDVPEDYNETFYQTVVDDINNSNDPQTHKDYNLFLAGLRRKGFSLLSKLSATEQKQGALIGYLTFNESVSDGVSFKFDNTEKTNLYSLIKESENKGYVWNRHNGEVKVVKKINKDNGGIQWYAFVKATHGDSMYQPVPVSNTIMTNDDWNMLESGDGELFSFKTLDSTEKSKRFLSDFNKSIPFQTMLTNQRLLFENGKLKSQFKDLIKVENGKVKDIIKENGKRLPTLKVVLDLMKEEGHMYRWHPTEETQDGVTIVKDIYNMVTNVSEIRLPRFRGEFEHYEMKINSNEEGDDNEHSEFTGTEFLKSNTFPIPANTLVTLEEVKKLHESILGTQYSKYDFIESVTDDNIVAYQQGTLTVYKHVNGQLSYYAAKHEPIHAILRHIVKPAYAKKIYEAGRKFIDPQGVKNLTDQQVEEYLGRIGMIKSDYHSDYTGLVGLLKQFIDFVREFITGVANHQAILDDFYYKVYTGKFKDRPFKYDNRPGDVVSDNLVDEVTMREIANKLNLGDDFDYIKLEKVFGGIDNFNTVRNYVNKLIVRGSALNGIINANDHTQDRNVRDTVVEIQRFFNAETKKYQLDKWVKNKDINTLSDLEEIRKYAVYMLSSEPAYLQLIIQQTWPGFSIINEELGDKFEKGFKQPHYFDYRMTKSRMVSLYLKTLNHNIFDKNGNLVTQSSAFINQVKLEEELLKAAKLAQNFAKEDETKLWFGILRDRANQLIINESIDKKAGEPIDNESYNTIMSFLHVFGPTIITQKEISNKIGKRLPFSHFDLAYADIQKYVPKTLLDQYRKKSDASYYLMNKFFSHYASNDLVHSTTINRHRFWNYSAGKLQETYKTNVYKEGSLGERIRETKGRIKSTFMNPDGTYKTRYEKMFDVNSTMKGFSIGLNKISFQNQYTNEEFIVKKDGKWQYNPRFINDAIGVSARFFGIPLSYSVIKSMMIDKEGKTGFNIDQMADHFANMFLALKYKITSENAYKEEVLKYFKRNSINLNNEEEDFGITSFYDFIEDLAGYINNVNADLYGNFTLDAENNKHFIYKLTNTLNRIFKQKEGQNADKDLYDHLVGSESKQGLLKSSSPLVYKTDSGIRFTNPAIDKNRGLSIESYTTSNGLKTYNRGYMHDKWYAVDHINSFIHGTFLEDVKLNRQNERLRMIVDDLGGSATMPIFSVRIHDGNIGKHGRYIRARFDEVIENDEVIQKNIEYDLTQDWINHNIETLFLKSYRQHELSLKRWNKVLPLLNIPGTLTSGNAKEKLINIPSMQGIESLLANNGLIRNLDFVFEEGKIFPGKATIMSGDIYNLENFQNWIETRRTDPGKLTAFRNGLFLEYFQNLNNIIKMNFGGAEYENNLPDVEWTLPKSFRKLKASENQMASNGPVLKQLPIDETDDTTLGDYTVNPFYEAYFYLYHITSSSVLQLTAGDETQYDDSGKYSKYLKQVANGGMRLKLGGKRDLAFQSMTINVQDTIAEFEQLRTLFGIQNQLEETDGLSMIIPLDFDRIVNSVGGTDSMMSYNDTTIKTMLSTIDFSSGINNHEKNSTLKINEDIINNSDVGELMIKKMLSIQGDIITSDGTIIPVGEYANLYEIYRVLRERVGYTGAMLTLNDFITDQITKGNDLRNRFISSINFTSTKKSFKGNYNIADIFNPESEFYQDNIPTITDVRDNEGLYLQQNVNNNDSRVRKGSQITQLIGIGSHNVSRANMVEAVMVEKNERNRNKVNRRLTKDPEAYKRRIAKQAQLGKDDPGNIPHLLNNSNITMDLPSLHDEWKKGLISNLNDGVSGLPAKIPGNKSVQMPATIMRWIDEDGNKQSFKHYRFMNDNGEEAKTKDEISWIKPSEIGMKFSYMKEFGFNETTTVNDAVTVKVGKDNVNLKKYIKETVGLEGYYYREVRNETIQKFFNDNDNVESPYYKGSKDALINYYQSLFDTLFVYSFRIPTASPSGAFIAEIVLFTPFSGNVVYVSPEKNLMDNADFDIDMLNVHFPAITIGKDTGIITVDHNKDVDPYNLKGLSANELDNQMFYSIYEFFNDPKNLEIITNPLTPQTQRDIIHEVKKNDHYNKSYDPASSIIRFMAAQDQDNMISRLANAVVMVGYLSKVKNSEAGTIINDIFNMNDDMSVEVTAEGKVKYIVDVIGSYLQVAVDNYKEDALRFLHINKTTSNIVTALALDSLTVEQIHAFLSNPVILKVLNTVHRSNASDRDSINMIDKINKSLGDYEKNTPEHNSLLQLKDYYFKGEFASRLVHVYGFHNNLKNSDFEVYRAKQSLEYDFGVSLDDYLKGNHDYDVNEFVNYHSKNHPIADRPVFKEIELAVRNLGNIATITYEAKNINSNLRNLQYAWNNAFKTNYMYAPIVEESRGDFLDTQRMSAFNSANVFYGFNNAVHGFILHKYTRENAPMINMKFVDEGIDLKVDLKQWDSIDFFMLNLPVYIEQIQNVSKNDFIRSLTFYNNKIAFKGDISPTRERVQHMKQSFEMFKKEHPQVAEMLEWYSLFNFGFEHPKGSLKDIISDEFNENLSKYLTDFNEEIRDTESDTYNNFNKYFLDNAIMGNDNLKRYTKDITEFASEIPKYLIDNKERFATIQTIGDTQYKVYNKRSQKTKLIDSDNTMVSNLPVIHIDDVGNMFDIMNNNGTVKSFKNAHTFKNEDHVMINDKVFLINTLNRKPNKVGLTYIDNPPVNITNVKEIQTLGRFGSVVVNSLQRYYPKIDYKHKRYYNYDELFTGLVKENDEGTMLSIKVNDITAKTKIAAFGPVLERIGGIQGFLRLFVGSYYSTLSDFIDKYEITNETTIGKLIKNFDKEGVKVGTRTHYASLRSYFNKNDSDKIQSAMALFEIQHPVFDKDVSREKATEIVKDISDKLYERTGLNYNFITIDEAKELGIDDARYRKGAIFNGKAYFIQENFDLDTPFHEYIHPFINAIEKESPKLYSNLISQLQDLIKTNKSIKYTYENVLARFESIPNKSKILFDQNDINKETMVEVLGKMAAGFYDRKTGTKIMDFIKELLRMITTSVKKLFKLDKLTTGNIPLNISLYEFASLYALGRQKIEIDDKYYLTDESQSMDLKTVSGIEEDLLVNSNKVREIGTFRERKYDSLVNSLLNQISTSEDYSFSFYNEPVISFKALFDKNDITAVRKEIRTRIIPRYEQYEKDAIDNFISFFHIDKGAGITDSENMKEYFGFDKKTKLRYTRETIDTVKKLIGYSSNTKVIRYSELEKLYSHTNFKDIYSPEFGTENTIAIIHGEMKDKEGRITGLDISLFDLNMSKPINISGIGLEENNLFANYINDSKAKLYKVMSRATLKDVKKFQLSLTAMKMKSIGGINIRDIGVLEVFKNKAQAYKVDMQDAIHDVKAAAKIEEFRKNLHPEVSKLFDDDKLTKFKTWERDYLVMLHSSMMEDVLRLQNMKRPASKVLQQHMSVLDNFVNSGGSNIQEMIEMLEQRRSYVDKQLNNYTDKAYDEERRFIAELLHAYKGIKRNPFRIRNLNNDATWGEFYFKNTDDVRNEILQDLMIKVQATSNQVIGLFKQYEEQTNGLFYDLRALYMKKHPNFNKMELVSEIGYKIFEPLIVIDEIENIQGELVPVDTRRIHYDINAPETQKAIRNGQFGFDQNDIKKYLEIGAKLADIVEVTIKDSLRHNELKSDRYWETNAKGERVFKEEELNKAVENLYNIAWTKGMMPVFPKRPGEYVWEGKVITGLNKWMQRLSQHEFVLEDIVDLSDGFEDTEDVPSFFLNQYSSSSDSRYGSLVRMKKMGLDYINDKAVLMDEKGQESFSKNIATTLRYFMMDYLWKKHFETDVMPAYQDAKIVLNNAYLVPGIKQNVNEKMMKDYIDVVVKGLYPTRNTDPITKSVFNVVKALTVFNMFTGIAFSVPVGITSLIANNVEGYSDVFANYFSGNPYDFALPKERAKAELLNITQGNKTEKLASMYNVYDSTRHEVLNIQKYDVTNNNVFNNRLPQIFNRVADVAERRKVMIQQMIHDGTWDAHDENGKYDAKKDKRWFREDGSQSKEQKFLMEKLMEDLSQDYRTKTEQAESKLPVRAYNSIEEMKFRYIADQLIGTYERENKPVGSHHPIWSALMQFKIFALTKIEQRTGQYTTLSWKESKWRSELESNPNQITRGGHYAVEYTEDGKIVRKYVEIEKEGYYVTVAKNMWNTIIKIKRGEYRDIRKWKQMSEMERYNSMRALFDLAWFLMFYGIYAGVSSAITDKDKTRALRHSRLVRAFKNGVLTSIVVSPVQLMDMFKQIPIQGLIENVINITTFSDDANWDRMIPGKSTLRSIGEVADFLSEDYEP